MKRVLITGAGSYVGTSVEKWLNQPKFAGCYQVDTVDMQDEKWRKTNFYGYDTVFHVAGIAHADIGKATKEQRQLYYEVNCDLAVETARKSKESGVKQFIYMSSIIVYGESPALKTKRVITGKTEPTPSNFYGDSKRKAEKKLSVLNDRNFHVAILRPPMIYGKGSKGNYPTLVKLACRFPVFPEIKNERSMLYIGNMCEFVRLTIENVENGILFPQNAEYVNTSKMVCMIADVHGKKIVITDKFNWIIIALSFLPGKTGDLINKAFGSLMYDKELSAYSEDYQVFSFEESINLTEKS